MTYSSQIKALLRKDFRIFRANSKASCLEVLFPIFMGVMTGLFILLIQVVQNNFGEYDNIHPIDNVSSFANNNTWFGFVEPSNSTIATKLMNYLNQSSVPTNEFETLPEALLAYQINRGREEYVAIDAVGQYVFTLYADLTGEPRWNLAFRLAELMTSFHVGYPQKVSRNVDREDFAELPNLRAIFSSTGCMLLIYAFIPSLILTAGRLVEEKRVKVRESLKVMGLTDSAYLISNFMSSALRMAVGTGLISVCLAAFSVIKGADIPAVFLIGMLFAFSLIAFAQVMPALFSASIWSNVMCILLLSGGAAVSSLSTGWGKGTEVLVCLLSPAAFYYGILPYMAQGTVTLLLSTSDAAVMLVIDTLLYIVIGNYIYSVAPGEFGVPKHPLFFIRWLWHKENDAKVEGEDKLSPQERAESRVILRDLVKFFGAQRESPSVDKLSLNVKRGEIFALLGHNGAGKTTTISILTGMITPTMYAEASVDGLDISNDMDAIRHTVGLCPQFDVLFNDLTARQHLELFAEIKGNVDQARIEYLMKCLELPDTVQRSSTFSGGTKRRLSVGNALVGGGTLIYLDEPSSGMDPLSRRKMWDLLKEERNQGKTIVLTTHFMEEADYLGERIAIMSRGRLYCCNTSQQLKETFGVGYYLILVKGETHDVMNAIEPKVQEALALVQKFVPDATMYTESSGEAHFLLPITALEQFGDMLAAVEQQLHTLGFHSYGLSMNTLEDVFVNISEREEAEAAKKVGGKLHKHSHSGSPFSPFSPGHSPASAHPIDPELTHIDGRPVEEIFQAALKVSHTDRFLHQMKTVFWRKVTMLRRTRRMQLMIILFPIFFIVVAFLVIQPQSTGGSTTDGLSMPDFMQLRMVNFELRDLVDNANILAQFNTLYKQAYPGADLTVYPVSTMEDYGSGNYIPMESLSFASGFKTPDITFGFLPHFLNLSAVPPVANYTFLFNHKFAPIVGTTMLAMLNTAIERAAGNNATLLSFSLQAFPETNSSTPQPTAAPEVQDSKETTYNFMQVGMYTVIAVVQLVANCALPVADEMQRQVYHANRVQGMSSAAYFLGNLLFDFACCLFPLALMILMIFFKGIGAFYSGVTFWVIVAGLMFSVHVVLQAYVLVTYVTGLKPVTYTGILHGANLAMMGAPYLAEVVMNAINFPNFANVKPFILALTPPAAFYHILDNTSDMTYSNTNAGYIMTLTGTVATAWGFIFMLIEYALPVTLLYLFATGKASKLRRVAKPEGGAPVPTSKASQIAMDEKQPLLVDSSIQSPPRMESTASFSEKPEDPDVTAERHRVMSKPEDNMVAAKELIKKFDAKTAVDNVTFGIRKGECFGLLGPNGAGKSTTCNVMLRDLAPTSGDVIFPYAGVSSETPNDIAFAEARIGVCLQGDSLWEFLSAAEHMDQYLRLRLTTLYEPEKWQAYIEKTIEKVYLADAENKYAGGYSGGMKRKLLVCLAMYTGALSVFLDEPSTGMDPFSRRALWSVILEALSRDRCVLLTTHSMEEADAVCSRISIITSGKLRCIGSSQHLKNRFGSGYVLTLVHDAATNVESLDEAVIRTFPNAELQEVLGRQRRYGLGKIPSLATAFRQTQALREPQKLLQYSISQTVSLEQIFLAFVGTAKEGETDVTH